MSKNWDYRPPQRPPKDWDKFMAEAPRPKKSWDERMAGIPPRPQKTTEEIILERQKWDSTTKQTFGVVKFD